MMAIWETLEHGERVECLDCIPSVEPLLYDPNPDDARRLRVLRAAAACPVQAIVVDRLDDTERGATS